MIATNVSDSSSLKTTIRNLAETNEVGIFRPEYYNQGKYSVEYTYLLHPPIEYDTTASHLNLKFAGASHIAYRNVKIIVPSGEVEQLYVYPPLMKIEKMGDTYVITGGVSENENLAVEILSDSGGFSEIQGYRNYIGNVKTSTSSAAFWYNLIYYLAYFLNYFAKAVVLLVPVFLLAIYYRLRQGKVIHGSWYLSTVPNSALKPWQVNLLFKGDALDFDEDGYYASLLDLHRERSFRLPKKAKGRELRSGYFPAPRRILTSSVYSDLSILYQKTAFLIPQESRRWHVLHRQIPVQKKKH